MGAIVTTFGRARLHVDPRMSTTHFSRNTRAGFERVTGISGTLLDERHDSIDKRMRRFVVGTSWAASKSSAPVVADWVNRFDWT
jgi:hypothetical protein